jgi:hypothetical protein
MTPELLEAFRQVRDLMANHWTRGFFARDQYGRITDSRGTDACRWCLLGAIFKVGDDNISLTIWMYEIVLEKIPAMYAGLASFFNDTEGQAAVVAMLDSIIAEGSAR